MLQFPSTVVAPKRASISPPAVSCLSSSSSSHSSSLPFASSPSLHHLSLSRLSKSAQPYPKQKKRIKVINEQTQPLKVMISGAPASGKGTQCELIVKKFGLVHISTGDLLRAEVSAGTDIGNKAKEYMSAGRLVPDEIVNAMVTTRLSLQDVKEKGWLLDGYPRSFVQAQSLESLNVKPDIYIVLNVPDEILIDRCVGRRLDPVTGKIYHIKNFLPEDEEVKGRLITRADDTEEKVKSRLEIYKQNVESILVMYKDIMKKVDGNRSKEDVFSEVDSLLSQFVKEKSIASEKQLKKSLPKQENWRGIPTRLNNIPHTREIREYFYADVLQATQKAISAGKTRLRVDITIPELNPEMDVYRIGTLMELIRVIALSYADDGKRVKVCVQGSMGEGALIGMPLQLAGTRKILEFMDWGDYGAIGTFINIGSIGANDVGEEDDIFILVAPQNAVGNCIIEVRIVSLCSVFSHNVYVVGLIMQDLRAMTDSAGSRPVILINPRLKDLPGSSGIMQTMGRDKRLEYAASFENCYHFRLLYYAGTQYPIMGALRMAYPNGYQLYKRVDDEQEAAAGREKEKYILLSTFEQRPDGDEINDAFDGRKRNQDKKTSGFWSFFSDVLG